MLAAGTSGKGAWVPAPSLPSLQYVARADPLAAELLVKSLDMDSADAYFTQAAPQAQSLLAATSAAVLAIRGMR